MLASRPIAKANVVYGFGYTPLSANGALGLEMGNVG